MLEFNDPNTKPDRIRFAFQWLKDHYPVEARKIEPKLSSRLARSEQYERAKNVAEKRRAGILIGMSASEVISSDWGRPIKINRTIFAGGRHEQWVYGGGNYLYFENGVLTAIQN